MSDSELLALFDREMRARVDDEEPGVVGEFVGGVVRTYGAINGVWYSELDSESAPGAVAEQVEFFRGYFATLASPPCPPLPSEWERGNREAEFEWKVYAHDQPSDLERILADNGFEPDEAETLMVSDLSRLSIPVLGDVRRVQDLAGVRD